MDQKFVSQEEFQVTRRTVWQQAGSSSVFRDPNHIKFKVIMWSIKIPRPKNNMTTKKTLQIIFASAVPIQKIPEILLINSVRDSGFSA